MAYPDASLLYINKGEIVERNLREIPHFQVLARFFANPLDYIERALVDEPS
jgi:predicted ATPase